MDGRRTALIVASDEFEHAGLSRLQAPRADAEALAGVLGDPQIGGFQVEVVHNAPSHAVQAHVEDLFAEGQPHDLLLLHFSGHGLKSDSGELFFASTNTRPDRLASTAVSADFVQRCMRGSRARSIVLFLDCCYGGAFGEGVAVRAAGPANVLDSFPAGKLGGGRGRAVITASSAMEYAFEGSALATDDQVQPSVFTSAVVQGLRTGAADRDEDGLVSLSELYDYVFDQVRAQNPNQTPSRDIELQGELYVAKSQRRRVRAVPLPPDLRAAVEDGNMYTRLGAVGELRARLASTDPGVALGAQEALQGVERSDTSYVADAAREALASVPAVDPPLAGALAPDAPAASHMAPASTAATRPPEPVGTAPAAPTHADPAPAAATESATTSRHRVPAGRTMLTGGSLMLLSAMLPDFAYGNGVDSFHPQLALVLLAVGAFASGVAATTLLWAPMRARWFWPMTTVAFAAVVTSGLTLAATADLGASEVGVSTWMALAGCLTTFAAGVVAVPGRRTAPLTSVVGHDEPGLAPTPLARAVGTGALVASVSAVGATYAAQSVLDPTLRWAWLVPGLVGLTGAVLILRPWRWVQVGPALLLGAGTAATWGLWGLVRIGKDVGADGLNPGFFLGLAGLVGLVALGAGACVVLRREHHLAMTRPPSTTLVLMTTVGLLAAIPFLRVARWNWQQSEIGNGLHDLTIALLVALVPVLTATIRPQEVGLVVLLGWACGTAGAVVDYWRLLGAGGYPLFGTPYVLIALVAAVVIAVQTRGGRSAPD